MVLDTWCGMKALIKIYKDGTGTISIMHNGVLIDMYDVTEITVEMPISHVETVTEKIKTRKNR
jgi:uncharacterized protein (DUF169 family)